MRYERLPHAIDFGILCFFVDRLANGSRQMFALERYGQKTQRGHAPQALCLPKHRKTPQRCPRHLYINPSTDRDCSPWPCIPGHPGIDLMAVLLAPDPTRKRLPFAMTGRSPTCSRARHAAKLWWRRSIIEDARSPMPPPLAAAGIISEPALSATPDLREGSAVLAAGCIHILKGAFLTRAAAAAAAAALICGAASSSMTARIPAGKTGDSPEAKSPAGIAVGT